MSKQLLGVIDATSFHRNLETLIMNRSAAAIPFGGRYRLIDFILSNMVNSGIENVAVFPEVHYRSLIDHLGSGRDWGLDRKKDGLFFFPSPELEGLSMKTGSFDHFDESLEYFYRSKQPYTIIANSYTVFNMNFMPVLNFHLNSGCDITELQQNGLSMGIYLLKTSLLIELIESRQRTGYSSMAEVTSDVTSCFSVCNYQHEGYATKIESVKGYYEACMKLLTPYVFGQLFTKEQPIYTKVKDEPPSRYTKNASVHHSIVANGVIIEGRVENSILSRGVRIGKGSVIRNSVIMQKCHVGEDCILDTVILDNDVKVANGSRLSGSFDNPLFQKKGHSQGVPLEVM
ncbi:sugar phosphate nucleotidyltransferase [Mesobacillus harenae]|uniref:sugar phosphate nucleotidyltransferase n=1 Tax=Mesobacillus harenae TaxID=2213203 RepID=UPI00158025D9|nr:sugar phosphate nucleotidyltransferase [Mesobacillus harenae]